MTDLVTVFWRDIPAQVMAKQRRQAEKLELSNRFAIAIDAAAMRAGLSGTDAYLQEWRRVSVPCSDDLKSEVEAAASRIEQEYHTDRLKGLVQRCGHEEPLKKSQ
ncbi:MAG: virulence factor [Gammaproteobacteria bacterium]|nr:virulence factor [Gammaproteobacteria bacterium]MCY4229234.1 virulence factor [Gammaproteobacteria bacterium]MCY4314048.1 virulence factor [Gammaproteobacteria bacterium]